MKDHIKNYIPWIITFFILLLGGMADYYVYKAFPFVIVADLRDIVKIILGIQAAIAVLSLSILTLLGSFVNKSYWGISISDFYSNKKNPKFKSLYVFFLGLVFIPIGLFAIIFKFYNFGMTVFIATIFIVLCNANNIYFVFNGNEAIKKDIELMYNKVFEIDNNKYEKMNLFETYCTGWKSIILEQSETDFQEYKKKYFNLYSSLINDQDSACVKRICNITQQLVKALLISSNDLEKQRGITFVEELYGYTRRLIIENNFFNMEFLKEFVLVSAVVMEFLQALQVLSSPWIENNFNWYNFVGNVDTIAIYLETKEKQHELIASQRISLQMGLL